MPKSPSRTSRRKPATPAACELRPLAGTTGVRIATGSYAAAELCGGVIKPFRRFYPCREQFHPFTRNVRLMLYVHEEGRTESIAAFMRKLEAQVMKHTKVCRIGPTSNPRITWIELADFWIYQEARRSLFTLLLRAGVDYDPSRDNFNDALFGNVYLNQTRPAVKRFLSGRTWFRPGEDAPFPGWHATFYNKREAEVAAMLKFKPIPSSKLLAFAAERAGLSIASLEQAYRREHAPTVGQPYDEVQQHGRPMSEEFYSYS